MTVSAGNIGARIRLARGRLTQDEFAARLGISKSTIGKYERGERSPESDILARMRSVLGIDINWLLTGEGPMRPGDREERESAASSDSPSSLPAEIDAALFGWVQEGVATVYREANMRLDLHALGEEAAGIYNDLSAAYTDPAERRIALKVLLEQLRRRLLRAEPRSGAGKEAS